MNEHHCGDLLGGYVLETLDEADSERVTAHMRICMWCREEAGIIADCLHDAMGYAVPPAAPGMHVRDRLLTRLTEEAAALGAMALPTDAAIGTSIADTSADASAASANPNLKDAASAAQKPMEAAAINHAIPIALPVNARSGGAAPTTSSREPRLLRPRWLVSVSLVAAVLVVGLGLSVFSMHRQLDDQRSHLLSDAFTGSHAAMPLVGPALKHGMSGEVIMRPGESTGLVIVAGVPKSTGKMAYTCWLHQNGRWMSGGKLRPNASGMAMVVLDKSMNVHQADQVVITLEQANASPTIPSAPVLSVML
ncbi:MAG: anti-sigma factor domain-containing protein [Chloroflexota bacterium]